MTEIFYSLQAFLLHTKSWTYVLMGLSVLAIWGFYIFISGRDEKIRKY